MACQGEQQHFIRSRRLCSRARSDVQRPRKIEQNLRGRGRGRCNCIKSMLKKSIRGWELGLLILGTLPYSVCYFFVRLIAFVGIFLCVMLGREGGFIFCTFLFCFQERSLFCTLSMVHTEAQCNLPLAAWICWQPVSRSKGWAPPQLSQVRLPQAPHHHSHRIQYFPNGVEFSISSSSPKLTSLQPSNKHVCPAATAELVCSCFWFSCLPKSAYLDYNTWSLDYSTLLCQGNAPPQFATAFLLQYVTEEILDLGNGEEFLEFDVEQGRKDANPEAK